VRWLVSLLVVGAVCLAGGAALANTGSEQVVLTPAANLSETGTVNLTVDGTGFEPDSVVRIDQMSSAFGVHKTLARAILIDVSSEGAFSTSVDLTYDMGGGQYCDHNPALSGGLSCELAVSYTAGGSGIAVKTPLQFGVPPTASLVANPPSGPVPLEVSLDGCGSADAADRIGSMALYRLDPGDGSGVVESPTQCGFLHTYTALGQYTATLTVTDIDGEQDTTTASVEVTEQPNTLPNAHIYDQYATTAGVGEDVLFYFYGNDQEGPVTLEFDFGDGSAPYQGDETSGDATHTYTQPGFYTPSLTVTDGDGATTVYTGLHAVEVVASNAPPAAQNRSVTMNEDGSRAIALQATDPDAGDTLTYTVVGGPANGTLSGTPPSVTYTPALNYNGPDSFTFKANDGTVDSNTATVSITVNPINDRPLANGQTVTTDEDTSKAITLGASDVDGGTLSFSIGTGPSHGSLSGTAPNLTYTPAANYNGPDSFTFRANDGTINSVAATVSITVNAINDAPVVPPTSFVTVPANAFREGQIVNLPIRFNDVDLSPLAAYQATVWWGDGTSTVATIDHLAPDGQVTSKIYWVKTAGHRYALFGTYDITVTVSDGSILVTKHQYRVPIADAPLLLVVLENDGRRNRLYPPGAKPLACGYDANALRSVSHLTGASISWGDGTAAQAVGISSSVVGCGPDATFSVRASHTYTQVSAGRTISVTVYSAGGSTATDTATIRILPQN
jgi:VCBS repeat-containing protein